MALGGISPQPWQQFPMGTRVGKTCCSRGDDAGAPHPPLQAAVFSLSHYFSLQQRPTQHCSGVSGFSSVGLTERGSPSQASRCSGGCCCWRLRFSQQRWHSPAGGKDQCQPSPGNEWGDEQSRYCWGSPGSTLHLGFSGREGNAPPCHSLERGAVASPQM